ncbi:MAG TPA: energy transducer TonB [Anaeromyxobacteraceae bacterium]|nr:energy transducer TonB [Anaeromyxobacteraceae bacterium]
MLAVAVSLVVNGAALLLVRTSSVIVPVHGPSTPVRAVELAPLSPTQWDANRRAAASQQGARLAPPLVLRPAPPPPPPQQAPGQVVDVAPSKNPTPPKESRFVSDHDSTVEKETRSRHAKAGYENTLAKPAQPNPAAPPPAERQQARAQGATPERAGVRTPGAAPAQRSSGAPGKPSQPSREKLAMRLERDGDLRPRQEHPEVRGDGGELAVGARPAAPPAPSQPGEAGSRGVPGGAPEVQLRPSASSYDRLAGGPAPDKLDGVAEGEGTYLNTREWKYASYFNRIKQAVATQWHPDSTLQLRDPTGQRFAYKDRITVLAVTLDSAGSLKDVQVQRSSGVDFLDLTAVDAFRKAQPFANPPRGIANDRGEIGFMFGFYLEVGSGLQIFRGPTPP